MQQNCVQKCVHELAHITIECSKKLHAAFCVQIPSLSLYPPRPHLQASEKLRSPIGLLHILVGTSLCGREMASEPNILKRDGGAYPKSGGHSTLMPLYLLLSPVCSSACSLSAVLVCRPFSRPPLPETDQTAQTRQD